MAARTGKAKLAAVIGYPVGHSLSPALHEYWLRSYDIDGAYIPLEVPAGGFLDTLDTLAHTRFRGANVTLPYKEQAYEAAASLDEMAQLTGAVNTLVRQEDGRFAGMNTDVYGFVQSLREAGVAPESLEHAVILGAGGAARAIAVGLAKSGCKHLTLSNRTEENAQRLAEQLHHAALGCEVRIQSWEQKSAVLETAQLLVNTTQLGMRGQPPLEINLHTLPQEAVVVDIIYNPLETALLKDAKARGHKTLGGLPMLLHQAAPGFEAWFGVRPKVSAELHHYIAGLVGT